MRRVLFSDLHGNDLALDRLLHAEAGTVISVGDVLGRAGSNQKCLERMRERGIPSVQGNHEMRMLKAYQSGLEDWAANWVRTWPLEFLDADALVTHTLFENHDFFDIELPEHVIKLLERRPLVFTGHPASPWILDVGAGQRALLDCGSLAGSCETKGRSVLSDSGREPGRASSRSTTALPELGRRPDRVAQPAEGR